MKIGELGEIGIINLFKEELSTLPHIILGIKTPTGLYEDTGVIDLSDGRVLIVTTDLIGKMTHMPPEMTPRQMGRKSITVNISDLAAMGAKPLGLVMSMGVPSNLEDDFLKELAKGMNEAAEEYKTCVFGGDTNKTDDLILAGTAIGITKKDELMTRHSAKPGDIVAVTGFLGSAAAGLQILLKKIKINPKIKAKLINATLEPKAQLNISLELAESKCITASGDITDGLAWELYKIAAASNCGILIKEEKIPILEATKKVANVCNMDPMELVMHTGEDFELVLTIKSNKWDEVKKICDINNVKLTQIGKVTDRKNHVIMLNNQKDEIKLQKKGYDQFFNRS